MKAEMKPIRIFNPIHITIETEKEAKILWYTLNASIASMEKEYKDTRYESDVKEIMLDKHAMWAIFNKIYPLRNLEFKGKSDEV